jgi:hypothetical protein
LPDVTNSTEHDLLGGSTELLLVGSKVCTPEGEPEMTERACGRMPPIRGMIRGMRFSDWVPCED